MLFKILQGDESRISLDITPFHKGWCYVTTDGGFYVDMNIGTEEVPNYQRVEVTSKSAYQIARAHGFEGTEEEWLESLKGDPGDPYELTDYDIDIIRSAVVETLTPAKEAIERRLTSLENIDTTLTDRIGILEAAVKNLSGLVVTKVTSLEEMTSENTIYLLPAEDGTYYYEYLVYNNMPELIGSTDIDLSNYVSKEYLHNDNRMYCHNVSLKYRHTNSNIHATGSDGVHFATFQIINTDPEPYSFTHNLGGANSKTMLAYEAWQFLRLYRAVQFTNLARIDMTLCEYCKPASGTMIRVNPSATNASQSEIGRAIIDSVIATYQDTADKEWQRVLVLQGTYIDENNGSTGDVRFPILCGHPTFSTIGTDSEGNAIKGEVTSVWKTQQEFETNEYNKTDGNGNSYATYFCDKRLYCNDNVEPIGLVPVEK